MKITTFNPQIVTKDADSIIKLFEELGFKSNHHQEGIGQLDVTGTRMKNENGFYIDISELDAPLPYDMIAIRMNVDDFDEAYEKLVSLGFKNFYGDQKVETKSAKSAMMISASGFAINLVQHIK